METRKAHLPDFGTERAHLENMTTHVSLAPTLCLREAWLDTMGPRTCQRFDSFLHT